MYWPHKGPALTSRSNLVTCFVPCSSFVSNLLPTYTQRPTSTFLIIIIPPSPTFPFILSFIDANSSRISLASKKMMMLSYPSVRRRSRRAFRTSKSHQVPRDGTENEEPSNITTAYRASDIHDKQILEKSDILSRVGSVETVNEDRLSLFLPRLTSVFLF